MKHLGVATYMVEYVAACIASKGRGRVPDGGISRTTRWRARKQIPGETWDRLSEAIGEAVYREMTDCLTYGSNPRIYETRIRILEEWLSPSESRWAPTWVPPGFDAKGAGEMLEFYRAKLASIKTRTKNSSPAVSSGE